jgi:hypothetical protein
MIVSTSSRDTLLGHPPTPLPRLHPPPSPRRFLGQHTSPDPDDTVPTSIPRPLTSPRGHTYAAHQELHVAEERDQQYEERQMLSLDFLHDIGDLVEAEEQDENLSGLEPEPSTHNPSVHTTSAHISLTHESILPYTVTAADLRYPDKNTSYMFFSHKMNKHTTTRPSTPNLPRLSSTYSTRWWHDLIPSTSLPRWHA